MKRWFGEDFDKDGEKAAEGKLSEKLLERLIEDRYIRSPPPKSTGREVVKQSSLPPKINQPLDHAALQ